MKQDAVMTAGVGTSVALAGITTVTAMFPLVSVVVVSSGVVVIVVVVMRMDVDSRGGQQHQEDCTGDRSGTNQMADQRKHGGHMVDGRMAVKRHR